MTFPPLLAASKDYMLLRASVMLGLTEDERSAIDDLIALAFMRGQPDGVDQARKAIAGETA